VQGVADRGSEMTEAKDTVNQASTAVSQRSWLRVALLVAVGLTLVAGAAYGLWWRADRQYVGTEVAATLTWGECLNGIGWTDPSNDAGWSAGHDIVVQGEYESEPVRVRSGQPGSGSDRPVRGVIHTSVGTIHFDSYDHATFTSRKGGTMQLTRPPRGMSVTADCVGASGSSARHRPPSTPVWAEVTGVLGNPNLGSNDIVLTAGMISVEQDGVEVDLVPIDGRSPFAINVPVGTVTLRGSDGRGECGVVTITVTAGDHVSKDLVCERS
jgi:hypothetical protein